MSGTNQPVHAKLNSMPSGHSLSSNFTLTSEMSADSNSEFDINNNSIFYGSSSSATMSSKFRNLFKLKQKNSFSTLSTWKQQENGASSGQNSPLTKELPGVKLNSSQSLNSPKQPRRCRSENILNNSSQNPSLLSDGLSQTSIQQGSKTYSSHSIKKKSINVQPNSFLKIKLLGKGDVGKVYLVKQKTTDRLYAMKGKLN
jgi:hypothetical protein